ncbi:MAG: hypothetical protein QOJ59_3928, partial [Thermomicrobiales bacterium]|nr:hypothetical protein [Thermomicrobiales bacterium]
MDRSCVCRCLDQTGPDAEGRLVHGRSRPVLHDPIRRCERRLCRFKFPGSVQGFEIEEPETGASASARNVEGHSRNGQRSLAISYDLRGPDAIARVATPTFIPPEGIAMPGYALYASPILHSGQTLRASLGTDRTNKFPVLCRLFVRTYGPGDAATLNSGPAVSIDAGADADLTWRVPDSGGEPIFAVGLEVTSA